MLKEIQLQLDADGKVQVFGLSHSPWESTEQGAALVAEGERDPDLHYFRYSRFAEGDLIRPTYDYGVLGERLPDGKRSAHC